MLFLQTIALVLMTLGGLIAAMNWLSIFQSWRTGRFHSAIPLIGGLFLCVGMLLLPSTRPYAWAALPLDYGTIITVFALPYLVYMFWSVSRFNLLEEYTGQLGIQTVHLRLFRRSIFILEQHIQRERGEYGIMQQSLVGEWEREGDRLMLRLKEGTAVLESSPGLTSESLRPTQNFPSHEGTELSLAGIDLHLKYKRAG
jgi:hypothetical protein